ncbi:MAG: hypothetical protein NTW49_12790 [Bacteroidia bacterium]|nr:hypothetical protein [Bacteroidia bacterium]
MKNMKEVDRLVRDALDNFVVTPPAHLAEDISKRMVWYNFWHFRIFGSLKLIVPLMVSIIVVSSSVFFILPGTEQKNKTAVSAVSVKEVVKPANVNASSQDETTISIKTLPDDDNQVSSQSPASIARTVNPVGPEAVNSSVVKVINDGKELEEFPRENAVALSETTPVAADQVIDPTIPGDIAMIQEVKSTEQMFSSSNKENLLPERISAIKLLLLPQQNDNRNNQAIVSCLRPPVNMTVNPLFGVHFSFSQAFANLSDGQGVLASKPGFPSGSLSAGIDYHISRFFIESGLQYSYFQTKENGNRLLYNPQIVIHQQLAGQQQVITSHSEWHNTYVEDSVLHLVNSVLVTHYDTSLVNVYIPVASTEYDTIIHRSWKSNISIVEIPVAAGYKYSEGNTEFSVKGGVLFGIISGSQGYTYDKISETGLVHFNEMYSTREIQYSYFISASIDRSLTEHWSVELSPFWRGSINGLRSNEGLPSLRYNAWGISLGIKYQLYFWSRQPYK